MTVQDPPIHLLDPKALSIGDLSPRPSGGGSHQHVYASTGKPTIEVQLASAADVDHAVTVARAARAPWRALAANVRRDLLLAFADLVVAHGEELAQLQVAEIGVPIQLARQMPQIAADYLRYNAGWLDKIGGAVVTTWPARSLDYTLDEPYGVIAGIIPWNGALVSMGQLLGPALAAGNTVVVKPSPLAPFVAHRMCALAVAAGIPPGVVNVVTGDAEAGDALVRHPGVDKVHFTGSGQTARRVLAAAAERLLPVAVELGGKSAHLIFGDADVRMAARLAMTGAVALSGQGCANGTRVLVHSSVHEQVLEILTARLRKIVVGDPLDPRTLMGPLVSQESCDRVLALIADTERDGGGRLVAGGRRLGGELADGYFVGPTVFADVDPACELNQHEIFGPVLTVRSFETEEEALELANGTPYGLGSYLHTKDLRRSHLLAAALDSGSVWVNGAPGLLTAAPFGGVKQSGFGRIGGLSGVREFLRPKNVWVSL